MLYTYAYILENLADEYFSHALKTILFFDLDVSVLTVIGITTLALGDFKILIWEGGALTSLTVLKISCHST